MTEQSKIEQQIRILTTAVIELSRAQGTRLSRAALAERLGVHPDSITRWLRTDKHFPRPDKTGQWRLADILKLEDEQTAPLAGPAFQPDLLRSGCSR